MTSFDSYRSNAAEIPRIRKWFLFALALSLVFHFALFLFFRATKLERFSEYTERLVPRAFTANRLEIDPKLLEPEKEEAVSTPSQTQIPKMDLPRNRRNPTRSRRKCARPRRPTSLQRRS